jgi:ABC-type multidrug transport system ATPase subunit
MPGRLRRERIDVVLEQVGLGGRGRDKIGGYSKGMTQRIGLAQALLADPALVLLDEPTSALDPVGRRDVRALIQQISSEASRSSSTATCSARSSWSATASRSSTAGGSCGPAGSPS